MLINLFEKLYNLIFPPENEGVLVPLEPVLNLKRVHANVKVTWEPNPSNLSRGQKIIVLRNGEIFIDKMLEPETAAFSFAAAVGSKVVLTILPFDGTNYGDPSTVEFIV